VEYAATDAFTYPGAPQVFGEAIADSLNGYAASEGVTISTVEDAPQCVLNPDFTGRRLQTSTSSSALPASSSFLEGSDYSGATFLQGRNVNTKAFRALQEDQAGLQRCWLLALGTDTTDTPSYTPMAIPMPTAYVAPGDTLTCGDVIKGSTVDIPPLWSDDDYSSGALSGDQSSTWGRSLPVGDYRAGAGVGLDVFGQDEFRHGAYRF